MYLTDINVSAPCVVQIYPYKQQIGLTDMRKYARCYELRIPHKIFGFGECGLSQRTACTLRVSSLEVLHTSPSGKLTIAGTGWNGWFVNSLSLTCVTTSARAATFRSQYCWLFLKSDRSHSKTCWFASSALCNDQQRNSEEQCECKYIYRFM